MTSSPVTELMPRSELLRPPSRICISGKAVSSPATRVISSALPRALLKSRPRMLSSSDNSIIYRTESRANDLGAQSTSKQLRDAGLLPQAASPRRTGWSQPPVVVSGGRRFQHPREQQLKSAEGMEPVRDRKHPSSSAGHPGRGFSHGKRRFASGFPSHLKPISPRLTESTMSAPLLNQVLSSSAAKPTVRLAQPLRPDSWHHDPASRSSRR